MDNTISYYFPFSVFILNTFKQASVDQLPVIDEVIEHVEIYYMSP
jgi:hypothetical protein